MRAVLESGVLMDVTDASITQVGGGLSRKNCADAGL